MNTIAIPWQKYCWACDAAFETPDPRQQNCDKCVAHFAKPTAQPDLEVLYHRRDDLFAGILAGRGDLADIAEYERLSTAIQDALCRRMDAYLDALRRPVSSAIVIDHEQMDAWLDSHSAADYLPASEE
jgi:hypothetical protein